MTTKASVTVKKTGWLVDGKQRKPNFKPLAAGVESIVVGHIIERTSDGIDVNGSPFRPYHPDYSLERRLSGRSASPVQLIWSGKMLNAVAAMSRAVVGNSMQITFGVKPRDDRNLIAAYQQRTRKWFGLSPDGVRELREWVSTNLLSIWGAPLATAPRPPRKPVVRGDKDQQKNIKQGARVEVKAQKKITREHKQERARARRRLEREEAARKKRTAKIKERFAAAAARQRIGRKNSGT